jgi:hypothetical protein
MKTVCQLMYDAAKGPNMAMNDRPCNCEENADDMVAKWYCLRHGEREPNYQQLFLAEEKRHLERMIDHADFKRDEKRDGQMMRRLPGDHDGWPSNEQLEYFKRGGR